jgi:hypothetical protein
MRPEGQSWPFHAQVQSVAVAVLFIIWIPLGHGRSLRFHRSDPAVAALAASRIYAVLGECMVKPMWKLFVHGDGARFVRRFRRMLGCWSAITG